MSRFQEALTLDGIARVMNGHEELNGSHLKVTAKPEEYTKDRLITPILTMVGCRIDFHEREFKALRKTPRFIDYDVTTVTGTKYFIEAKPLNAKLDKNDDQGALVQVIDAMRLAEVRDEYKLGIATDGYSWIFVNGKNKVVGTFDICNDFDIISSILKDEMTPQYDKEEISKKFYNWYHAILRGGSYKDRDGKTRKIDVADCLEEGGLTNVVSPESRRIIAQVIMNRLIFIKFLESRGIINFPIIDYLDEQDEYSINQTLSTLFFSVMNTPVDMREAVHPRFKDIPYLNGGLFSPVGDELRNAGIKIKIPLLKVIFTFLNSFKFNHEVGESVDSLDPEILGYIFEMSMMETDRKKSGAFYTPRDITSYMTDETIQSVFVTRAKEYLRADGMSDYALSKITSVQDLYRLEAPIQIGLFEQLKKMRICDNACGSGAFLLSAADTLFDIYYNICQKGGIGINEIGIKNSILKYNIYGVDLNSGAVEIAKLRLWLWVVDSYRSNNTDALPNIDFNIRSGNSLIGYVTFKDMVENTISLDQYGTDKKTVSELLEERDSLVERYRSTKGVSSKEYGLKATNLNDRIKVELDVGYMRKLLPIDTENILRFVDLYPFHWGLEFHEVFEQGGFDVIVGNPPYVQLQKIKGLVHDFYESTGYKSYDKTGDIYCLFYERSNQILKEGGMLSYITSNKWMRNEYGKPLRDYFMSETEPLGIIDMADLQVFASATVECGIMTFESKKTIDDRQTCTVPCCTLDDVQYIPKIKEFVSKESRPVEFQRGQAWAVDSDIYKSIESKMAQYGKALKEWDVSIYIGLLNGFNDAFIINEEKKNELTSGCSDANRFFKPIVRGRDVSRFKIADPRLYMIVIPFGYTNKNRSEIAPEKFITDECPTIISHLKSVQEQFEKGPPKKSKGLYLRENQGEYWWELRSCDYLSEFSREKIVWGEIADRPKFSLDLEGRFYAEATTFFMVGDHLEYLVGILNSKLSEYAFSHIGTTTGMGTTRWKKYKIELLNVPVPDADTESAFKEKVLKIIDCKKQGMDTAELERDIDTMVYGLYHLNEDEIREIESTVIH